MCAAFSKFMAHFNSFVFSKPASMNHLIPSFKALKLFMLSLSFGAIALVSSLPLHAQMARKQPMMEHFTNASCGPCASQNPLFEPVREAFLGSANHVAYHTSWPGTDPMYTANAAENNAMVAVYGVTGVPSMILDGVNIGGPAGVSAQTLENAIAQGSPIRVRVEESGTTSRMVAVHVDGVGEIPSGTYRLRVLVIEDPKNYLSPPGSNGERNFPNVFRKALPGTTGTIISLPESGNTESWGFEYTVDPTWDEANTFVVAYVQNTLTREVLNSGSSRSARYELAPGAAPLFQPGNTTSVFLGELLEFGTGTESLKISLSADQPTADDWNATLYVNDSPFTSGTDLTMNGGEVASIRLDVTSYDTPGIGEYSLEVSSNDNPSLAPQRLQFVVVNNITDLIVNSGEGFGDGTAPGSYDTYFPFTGGLAATGRETRASMSHFTFVRALPSGVLDAVPNVYYNASWTFPAMSNEKVEAFMDFLDRGGNLFISGQDLAWEIMDAGSPYGTPVNRNFFLNYLKGLYTADGSPATTSLSFSDGDTWFGTAGSSSINPLYGAGNVYPDEIRPSGPEAVGIMYYNGDPSRIGGLRTEADGYKMVWLGTGLEMFGDQTVAREVVQLAHDYFWNDLSGLEFDELLAAALLGQNAPNPANTYTIIPLYDWNSDGVLRLSDLHGRQLREIQVSPGQNRVELDLSGLSNGLYLYTLSDGQRSTSAKKLTVLR